MFGFGRKHTPATRLARLLAGYPAWAPPHRVTSLSTPGADGPILTRSQARDNLVAWRHAVPERIGVLDAVLSDLGLRCRDAYDDAAGFIRRLHPLLLDELPALYDRDLARREAWELSDRGGHAIVLSFLGDLAMLSGDVLVRAKPGAFWGLDLDPRGRTKFSCCRPCLLGLADRLFPDASPDTFHLEAEWFGWYANMDDPTRLATPDPPPGSWTDVIGGTLPLRLERYRVHPQLARLREESWMRDAA